MKRILTREEIRLRRKHAVQKCIGYIAVAMILAIGIAIGASVGAACAVDKVHVTYHVDATTGTVLDQIVSQG